MCSIFVGHFLLFPVIILVHYYSLFAYCYYYMVDNILVLQLSHLISQQFFEVGVIIHILKVRKLSPREVRWCAQGYPANQLWSQEEPGSQTSFFGNALRAGDFWGRLNHLFCLILRRFQDMVLFSEKNQQEELVQLYQSRPYIYISIIHKDKHLMCETK